MKLKKFDILLDIKRNRKTEEFEVVQGDYDTNVLNIAIVDELNHYDLSNTSVEIVFRKPDGTTVLQSDITIINASQGKIQCILKTNTIAAPGRVNAEVRLLQNDKLLTSARFEFYVRQAIMNDETIESTNEFPVLTQLINEVRQIEAQVPEEVVNNLNTLQDYINGLSGQGRTTETVKQNADDIVNLADELKTHKAESASKHITESGTNENGNYIKFDDGTMICVLSKIAVLGAETAIGSMYYNVDGYSWTYPASFIAPASANCILNGSVGAPIIVSGGESHELTRAKFGFNSPIQVVAANRRLSLLAIGRWK